ncbi:MAG TPA: M14 family metallopeptidase [Steroidobacteraceae bacterium]|nr:M14 family metallopeptidase [Steroidobacteraceae bacterium]
MNKKALVFLLASALSGFAHAQPLAPLPFDHILRYDDLTTLLHSWADARPNLVQLESIGTTPEGRAIWFLTLSNKNSGPAQEKPALVVDGNMHATEWAGGVAALDFAWKLLRDYGSDERVTRLLDTRTVYVLPRMTPDGVEATLAQGRFIRSVDRPYPSAVPYPGIHARDIDGDGRTVFMRFRDPNGPWKQYARDPRLLVPRAPDESGGDYWRVLPEGVIEAYDGVTIADAPAQEPLDLGANFPADLGTAPPSRTAGPYPTSEPEVAAYVAAIARRPNIVAHVTCHTFGGLILTPPVNVGEHLAGSDRRTYETLAARAAALTGYRAMSYLDLRSEDRESYLPSAFGWLYNRRGIYSFITEFWNPLRAAGISLENTSESAWLFGYHPVEDEVKLLRWSDQKLGGDGFVAWHGFDHPQLGKVEIGGFDLIRYWYNVPYDRLEKEVAPHSEWLVYLGLATARLSIRSLSVESIGQNLWRVRLVVENSGWLPTNGSQQALDQQVVNGVVAELTLPAAAHLVEGAPRRSLGQLEGRTGQRSTATWWGYSAGTPDRAVADWIIAAPAGTAVSVKASHERGGNARAEVILGKEGESR